VFDVIEEEPDRLREVTGSARIGNDRGRAAPARGSLEGDREFADSPVEGRFELSL
jgi:hypothetical protein